MNSKKSHSAFFPLGVFLFPGEESALHIFEKRYKLLIQETLSSGVPFTIPFVRNSEMTELGSRVLIKEIVRQYPGGEMDIVVVCSELVFIHHFALLDAGKQYPGGECSPFEWDDFQAPGSLLSELERLRKSAIEIDLPEIIDGGIKVSKIASALIQESDAKYDFVKMSRSQKIAFLKYHINLLPSLHDQEQRTFHNIYLN